MLACFHRIDGEFGMPMIGRRDDDSINIFPVEQSAIVEITGPVTDAYGARQPFLIHIADGHNSDVIRLTAPDQALQVAGAHVTHSDYPKIDAVVSPQNTSRYKACQRCGTSGEGTTFQESTARDFQSHH